MTRRETKSYSFPPFCLDEAAGFLSYAGQELSLRPKSFSVLTELVRRHGELIRKDELLEAVWPRVTVEEAALKNCIREIRSQLGDDPRSARYIQTVHRRGYRFVAAVTAIDDPRSAESNLSDTTPALMVQRAQPLAELNRLFDRARQGERQVIFIRGEAGIGKSTLVEHFLAQESVSTIAHIGRGECIERYGTGEAFLPVLDLLSQWLSQDDTQQVTQTLRHYAPSWAHRFPQLRRTSDPPSSSESLSIRELCDALDILSDERPLVLVLEDLQWSDQSTLDFLASLARRSSSANLMLIGSYRTGDVLRQQNALLTIKQEMLVHRLCSEVPLQALEAQGIAEYLKARFGEISARAEGVDDLVDLIEQRTEGNPLFMVELMEHLLENDGLERLPSSWVLNDNFVKLIHQVPVELKAFVNQQIDRLKPEMQAVLEAGSVVGREFSARLIESSPDMPRGLIEELCTELADRGQFIRFNEPLKIEGGETVQRFGFLHRLHQETLTDRIPPARRIKLYADLALQAERLFINHPESVATELASMFEGARDFEKAVHYLELSSTRALRAGTLSEARQQISRAFELLEEIADAAAREALRESLSKTRERVFSS